MLLSVTGNFSTTVLLIHHILPHQKSFSQLALTLFFVSKVQSVIILSLVNFRKAYTCPHPASCGWLTEQCFPMGGIRYSPPHNCTPLLSPAFSPPHYTRSPSSALSLICFTPHYSPRLSPSVLHMPDFLPFQCFSYSSFNSLLTFHHLIIFCHNISLSYLSPPTKNIRQAPGHSAGCLRYI